MVAHQPSPSVGFSRKSTRVGCHFFLQGIFLTQGLSPHLLCLLHCRWILYLLSHHWGSPYFFGSLHMICNFVNISVSTFLLGCNVPRILTVFYSPPSFCFFHPVPCFVTPKCLINCSEQNQWQDQTFVF